MSTKEPKVDKITVYTGTPPVTPLPEKYLIECPECKKWTMVNRGKEKCRHCDWVKPQEV